MKTALKRHKWFLAGIFLLGPLTSGDRPGQACDSDAIVESSKKMLEPYKYDAAKVSKIRLSDEKQRGEIEVPLFWGEKYRFVFDRSGAPQKVEVEIYDKESGKNNRKLLFSSAQLPDSKEQFVYEPERSNSLYVNYVIPPQKEGNEDGSGCMAFVLGYKINMFDF